MTDPLNIGPKMKALPWFFLALFFAAAGSGSTGLYFGYQYATSKLTAVAARDRENLVVAYTVALEEKELRRKEAAALGRKVEQEFMVALRDMKVVNKTFYSEIQKETEKLVYTDCKVPANGIDLLNKHIDEVNLRLIDRSKQ